MTPWISAVVACRSARIEGIATFTTNASTTKMNCAATTIARTHQRRSPDLATATDVTSDITHLLTERVEKTGCGGVGGSRPGGASGGRGFAAEDELVVGDDASPIVDDEDFETARHHGFTHGGQHLPVKRHDIAQRPRIPCGAEAMATVADILLMRAGDALFERVVAARFPLGDKMLAVGRPQFGNREAAASGIGFVPHRDIAVGKALRVTHDITPTG